MGSLKKLKDVLVDMLGHPILKGSTVLTNGYQSTALDTIVKIEKVNKKTAVVSIPMPTYDYLRMELVYKNKRMLKQAYQLIVIDAQLAYNAEQYPEYLL